MHIPPSYARVLCSSQQTKVLNHNLDQWKATHLVMPFFMDVMVVGSWIGVSESKIILRLFVQDY